MLSCLPLRIITNLFTNKNTREEEDKINLRRRGRQPKGLSKVKSNEKKLVFYSSRDTLTVRQIRLLTPISTYLSNLFTLAVADCRFHKFDQWDAHGVVFNATVTRSVSVRAMKMWNLVGDTRFAVYLLRALSDWARSSGPLNARATSFGRHMWCYNTTDHLARHFR